MISIWIPDVVLLGRRVPHPSSVQALPPLSCQVFVYRGPSQQHRPPWDTMGWPAFTCQVGKNLTWNPRGLAATWVTLRTGSWYQHTTRVRKWTPKSSENLVMTWKPMVLGCFGIPSQNWATTKSSWKPPRLVSPGFPDQLPDGDRDTVETATFTACGRAHSDGCSKDRNLVRSRMYHNI